ncbi:DNA-binding transcriptional regulator DsdC [Desulforhopalus sp. IMCC35007]|uniref:DNA-binding transcriptional regulator DsdC n=1 Tax=Desulforhopalus sp. IMCC35007 TaxID=2569543 RepID=UPI0010ADFBDA|nr:DNA-binding transcriptional regulator DsdC [Desulforhopalus sp. IMCC35007]TKB06518.1 DNA-binding transcriptional regulator DsdC [Desulforhopalus sp. IMCC35007]
MDQFALRQALPLLPIFICTAKHQSFSKAAEELCITQGAISQNIRKLENILGFSLFHRLTRRIMLTEKGERLLVTVHGSLTEINDEVESIKSKELTGSLNISCPPTFASKWLAPRLKSFTEKNPGITIHFRCRNDLVDFEKEHVDLAIYYGKGTYPDLNVTFLMNEYFFPVCSRQYADQFSLWKNPGALQHCLLLHDSQPWPHAQYYSEWKLWAEQMKLTDLVVQAGISFDQNIAAVIAATEGIGVALGRNRLVQLDIEAGHLVAPIGTTLLADQSYCIVTMHEDTNAPRIAAFRHWLLGEAAQ